MQQGQKMGLHARSRVSDGPSFLRLELILKDIVDLFDFPAQEVEQRDKARA